MLVRCADGPWEGREIDVAASVGQVDGIHEDAGDFEVVAYRVERTTGLAWLVRPAPRAPWWRRLRGWLRGG